jgi:hypothetical protein
MKKLLLVLSALFLFSTVLSGCGPKEADPEVQKKMNAESKKRDEGG